MNKFLSHATCVIVGFGSIGQSVIPLLLDAGLDLTRLHIFDYKNDNAELLAHYRIRHFNLLRITPENHEAALGPLLDASTVLLNLAVEVSTVDLITLCQARGALYIDTSIEPWSYDRDAGADAIETTNYELREAVLKFRSGRGAQRSAIVAHGANPGFVSILTKVALAKMARDNAVEVPRGGASRDDWAALASELDVRVIQISERDSQVRTAARAEREFVNTWSVEGLIVESLQPAELGWGTHEQVYPKDLAVGAGLDVPAISLSSSGMDVKVRSWSPNALDFVGNLITHNEAISIADYYSLRKRGELVYRPTCYYAYHATDLTVDSLSALSQFGPEHFTRHTVLKDEIIGGGDELGVLLISGRHRSLWVGSCLSIEKARKQARFNSATSLQVVSSLVAGIRWMLENPNCGVRESDELDYEFLLEHSLDYWNPIVMQYTDWPMDGRPELQFQSFRVATA